MAATKPQAINGDEWRLVMRVVDARRRKDMAESALKAAEQELSTANALLGDAWGSLRTYQDELVEAAMRSQQ